MIQDIDMLKSFYGSYSTKVKAAKVSLKKPASKKGRKVTVSWKKVSGAKGYQILYADNANMKGANSVIVKKTSTTLKNLQKGKKCYIKVRALVKTARL